MSAARKLRAAIGRSAKGHGTEPITDEFAQAVAKRLESREIVRVPGLADEPEWFDVAIEQLQRTQREREEALRQSEKAREAPRSTSSIIATEIARAATGSGSAVIPLNGAAVLQAALSGGHGTVNGGAIR
jgi:Mg-chelatase subunit ChlI